MTERVAAVPTLDQLADHPETAAVLPRATVQALLYRALAAQQACVIALMGAETEAPSPPAPDRLLSARDAAGLLGCSPITLLRNRHRLPYRDFTVSTGTRRPAFSLQRIQDYIKAHAGSAASTQRRRPIPATTPRTSGG